LLCNPHNPLGIVWTPEELRRMADLCRKPCALLSDEIHSDLIFHGKKHVTPRRHRLPGDSRRYVITGISGTKTFNLAGLQASAVVFPNAHEKAGLRPYWQCMDIHRNNAFSLTAMEAAFTGGEEWLGQLLPYISANFDFVVDACRRRIPRIRTYAPDATYLMWLDCRGLGLDNDQLHDFMIRQAKPGPQRRAGFRPQPHGLHAPQRRLPPQRAGGGHGSPGAGRERPAPVKRRRAAV
jgi:cystathionine beta-lyase